MDAKEAIKINARTTDSNFIQAKAAGYLDALTGPEVTALVEAATELSRVLNEHLGFRYYPNGVQPFLDLIERTEKLITQIAGARRGTP